MVKIAILIPCYNEGKTVKKVILDWRTNVEKAYKQVQVYVYDNNSTDDTAKIAAECGAIVVKEPKQGKGNVIRSMFQDVDADCYLMVDGDDTYSPDHAVQMCRMVLDEKLDMVVGDRLSSTYYQENTRRFHGLGNTLVRKSINMIFQSSLTDIMTGCRAFSRRFVKTLPVISRGFEIETEMTIHALDKNMNIGSIKTDYKERDIASESKLQTIPDGIRVMLTIFNMFKDYRPLLFFFLISCFLTVIDIVFFIPIFHTYLLTGLVFKFPTLIVICFIWIAALLSFFTGLILDSIHKKEQREFEYILLHANFK